MNWARCSRRLEGAPAEERETKRRRLPLQGLLLQPVAGGAAQAHLALLLLRGLQATQQVVQREVHRCWASLLARERQRRDRLAEAGDSPAGSSRSAGRA